MGTAHASSHPERCNSSWHSRPGRYAREHGNELIDRQKGANVRLNLPEAHLLDKLSLYVSLFLLAGGKLDRRTKVKVFDIVAAAIMQKRSGDCRNYLALRHLGRAGWIAMIESNSSAPRQNARDKLR
jgi:hypothetical protein